MGKVRKEKANLVLERRRQDIVDMDRECAQTDAGGCGLASVISMWCLWVWPGTGGSEVTARQRRAVEREGRRRRRREKREKAGQRERDEHRQGLSTDDELLETSRLKFDNSMGMPL